MTTQLNYSIQLADGKHRVARDLIACKLDDYNNANSERRDNTRSTSSSRTWRRGRYWAG